jgi:hypothetical protein
MLSCSSNRSKPADQPASFAPVAMRIHPIFTRVKDFNGDNYPDGIDALLEFQDQFGDPTKASGTVIFEIYEFQKFDPQRKGKRLANPWVGSLETMDDQRMRWNRTSRTYSFPLQFDQINPTNTYVLTAQFQMSNGGRFHDEIVLEPPQGAYAPKGTPVPTTSTSTQPPATAPTSAPTTQPSSQP